MASPTHTCGCGLAAVTPGHAGTHNPHCDPQASGLTLRSVDREALGRAGEPRRAAESSQRPA